MTAFFVVGRTHGQAFVMQTVEAENAIEAIRVVAAKRAQSAVIYTAYREVVTKRVDVEHEHRKRVVFS